MKAIRLMLWVSLIGVAMMTITVSCAVKTSNKDKIIIANDGSLNADNSEWESASFFPYYITSMNEQTNSLGEVCYWMVYDDIDAGFENTIVSMDKETFQVIQEIWKESLMANRYCVNEHNASMLRLLDEYQPVIYNNKGTVIILLSDKD